MCQSWFLAGIELHNSHAWMTPRASKSAREQTNYSASIFLGLRTEHILKPTNLKTYYHKIISYALIFCDIFYSAKEIGPYSLHRKKVISAFTQKKKDLSPQAKQFNKSHHFVYIVYMHTLMSVGWWREHCVQLGCAMYFSGITLIRLHSNSPAVGFMFPQTQSLINLLKLYCYSKWAFFLEILLF